MSSWPFLDVMSLVPLIILFGMPSGWQLGQKGEEKIQTYIGSATQSFLLDWIVLNHNDIDHLITKLLADSSQILISPMTVRVSFIKRTVVLLHLTFMDEGMCNKGMIRRSWSSSY